MADNTTRNITSGGDTIRDIDRSLNPVPIAAKTTVVQLDAGGQYGENLVAPINPLPVYDQYARVGALLLQQQGFIIQAGTNGFIPFETPSFLIGV